ncbi:MAG: choline-sulfatase, partial [Lentisphaerae bacterium]
PVPDPILGEWSQNLDDIPPSLLRPTCCLNNIYRYGSEQLRQIRRAYYATITQIDYNLGLLFARLREMNLLENTWIIFTTDHGDMLGDHHLGAKSIFLEGSAHIPLIIRPPAASFDAKPNAGKRVDNLAMLNDIMPTILSIAGIEIPDTVTGKNLLAGEMPERTFIGHSESFFAVLQHPWKYLWCSEGGDELLFNLDDDPGETRNLAATATEELQRLRGILTEHLRQYAPEFLDSTDQLKAAPVPPGRPWNTPRWPGFHSIDVHTDVLH